MDAIGVRLESMVARNAPKLSVGENTMFALCADSLAFGCNWGFLKSSANNFKATLNVLRDVNKKGLLHFERVSNGVLLVASEEHLLHILNVLCDGKCPRSYMELVSRRKSEPEVFNAWLTKLQKDYRKLKYVQTTPSGYVVSLAVYGVNDTHEIREDGTAYPSFKVTLSEFLGVMASKPDFQRMQILIGENMEDNKVQKRFVAVSALQSMGDGVAEKSILMASKISNANTGVLIKIRV